VLEIALGVGFAADAGAAGEYFALPECIMVIFAQTLPSEWQRGLLGSLLAPTSCEPDRLHSQKWLSDR
jgi:hypothetical protein